MPLREELERIGRRIVDHFDRHGDPPFVVYQYSPRDEWRVRRDAAELGRWLEAAPRRVTCASISLARLFWEALEDSGFMDELIRQERDGQDDPAALHAINDAVGEILRQSPTLPERVLAAVEACEERTAVFLYRAGVLYPSYRTSTLLDDLRGQLQRPVTLLYPGRLAGDYGLSFMGRTDPAYGYRALIVPREATT